MRSTLWFPGHWPSVSEGLELMRTTGAYQADAANRMRLPRDERGPTVKRLRTYDDASLAARKRVASEMDALFQGQPVASGASVPFALTFQLVGHHRHSPGGWLLASHWIYLGIVDSKIFNKNAACTIAGICFRSNEEERRDLRPEHQHLVGRPGMIVDIEVDLVKYGD